MRKPITPTWVEPLEGRRLCSAVGDVPDVTPPVLVGEHIERNHKGRITAVVLTFSEPLRQSRAENVDNYVIAGKVEDKSCGGMYAISDPDCNPTARNRATISRAIYDDATHTVTLIPRSPIRMGNFQVLRVAGDSTGITDVAGNRLDGDRDGIEGGFVGLRFEPRSGRRIKFTDANGDIVRLRLTGKGTIVMLRQLRPGKVDGPGTAIQLWLDSASESSILTGSVQQHGTGDGTTPLPELINPAGARIDLLDDLSFVTG